MRAKVKRRRHRVSRSASSVARKWREFRAAVEVRPQTLEEALDAAVEQGRLSY